MELNREQIVKALEFCTGIKKLDACANCPAHLGCNDCVDFLREESLALIKELIEENDRLKTPTYLLRSDGGVELMPTIESIRADTVRKMQERLKECFYSDSENIRNTDGYIRDVIDQIAEEMLED